VQDALSPILLRFKEKRPAAEKSISSIARVDFQTGLCFRIIAPSTQIARSRLAERCACVTGFSNDIPFTPLTLERLFFALFSDSGLRHADRRQGREFETVSHGRELARDCGASFNGDASCRPFSRASLTGFNQPYININAAF
jgi:hypothetical protein